MSNIPTRCRDFSRAGHFLSGLGIIGILAMCLGCWEEIHYEPTQASLPATPTASQEPSPQEPSQPIEQPATEEKQESSLPADDLFEVDEQPSQTNTPQSSEQPGADENSVELAEPEVTSPTEPAVLEEAEISPETIPTETTPPEPIAEAKPEQQPAEPSSATSSRDAIAVWQMNSKWSLAAAYFAKGLEADRYGEMLDQAGFAADLLEISLPDFSELNTADNRQSAVARFLIEEAGPRLVKEVAANNANHAALAEFAINTHALLLVYTPLNKNLDVIVASIRSSAEKSQLPAELWQPIVEMLERRASFQEVKQAIFQLHEQTAAHLSR